MNDYECYKYIKLTESDNMTKIETKQFNKTGEAVELKTHGVDKLIVPKHRTIQVPVVEEEGDQDDKNI